MGAVEDGSRASSSDRSAVPSSSSSSSMPSLLGGGRGAGLQGSLTWPHPPPGKFTVALWLQFLPNLQPPSHPLPHGGGSAFDCNHGDKSSSSSSSGSSGDRGAPSTTTTSSTTLLQLGDVGADEARPWGWFFGGGLAVQLVFQEKEVEPCGLRVVTAVRKVSGSFVVLGGDDFLRRSFVIMLY